MRWLCFDDSMFSVAPIVGAMCLLFIMQYFVSFLALNHLDVDEKGGCSSVINHH